MSALSQTIGGVAYTAYMTGNDFSGNVWSMFDKSLTTFAGHDNWRYNPSGTRCCETHNPGAGFRFAVDVGRNVILSRYVLGSASYSLSWVLYGSTDNSAWTQVDAQSCVTDILTKSKEVVLSNWKAYRYYSLEVLCSHTDGWWNTRISELNLFTTEPSQCAACAAETYETTACTNTTTRACTACAACSPGTFESTACTSTTNRACTTCTGSCASGTYEATACTGTTNRVCGACPVASQSGRKYTHTYTGSVVEWQVPLGVTSLSVKMWGGGGGGSAYEGKGGALQGGGGGGYATGTIPVTPGDYVYLAVGQAGIGTQNTWGTALASLPKTFPNGGFVYTQTAGNGGGRSQISVFSSQQADRAAAVRVANNIRMIAAGGGGGVWRGLDASTTNACAAGYGGGGIPNGRSHGDVAATGAVTCSRPGTQTAGGQCTGGRGAPGRCGGTLALNDWGNGGFLKGGIAAGPTDTGAGHAPGGGGDGYYGGSSGIITADTAWMGGGAGGSSYLHSSVSGGSSTAGGDGGSQAAGAAANAADADNANQYGKGGGTNSGGWACTGACDAQNGAVVFTAACGAGYAYNSATQACDFAGAHINLARSCGADGKSACATGQISTLTDGGGGVAGASSGGNDANEATFSHTTEISNPWWRVDLGVSRSVGGGKVQFRLDAATHNIQARNDGFKIWIGNQATYNGAGNANCFTQTSLSHRSSPFSVTFDCLGTGQYVFVHIPRTEYLCVTEMYVFPQVAYNLPSVSIVDAGLSARSPTSIGTAKAYYRFTSTAASANSITFDRDTTVRVLVVGGGGSGGRRQGGGGGAGAMIRGSLLAKAGTTYTVTVGDGGAGIASSTAAGADANGNQGKDSKIADSVSTWFLAKGGGAGRSHLVLTTDSSGGSGGGGCTAEDGSAERRNGGTAVTTNVPSGLYGYNGGSAGRSSDGNCGTNACWAGAGGGGVTARGGNTVPCVTGTCAATGGLGGAGSSDDITGTAVIYAGGGGGGTGNGGIAGLGGTGGGGAGSVGYNSAASGAANTGGGGGGSGFDGNNNGASGAGGSGVVILQWNYFTNWYCLGGAAAPAACTVCSADSYLSTICSSSANAVCTPCTVCAAGTYEASPCTSTSNRACTGCTTGGINVRACEHDIHIRLVR